MGVIEILKPHNLEAYQEINSLLESGVKKIAIPRATGSGKTYVVGALAEQFNDEKKLVLEPTRPLLNSIKEKFDEFGIENTDFITYQKLIRMSDEDIAAMDYRLIFLDEFHHGTAPVWGMKIDYLMKTHTDSIIFGTSATTVRNDGVNVVETLFDNNAIGELSLSTAIARKVLPCPHYITAIYRIDDEFEKLKKRVEDSTNSKDEKKEFYHKMQEMKVHFEKSYGIPLILNKYIKIRNGKYLVFCKNKKHLNLMRDVVINWFQTAGVKDIHSYAVYSDYPEKERDYEEFCDDNSDSAKILFSINMLNEGLHIEDISGVLMLRTTKSNLVYLQQLGRLLEAGNMDKYLLVFDFVNNFSSANDGVGLLKEVKDAITREKESDPDFDDSGFEDIDTYFVIDQILEVQEMFREIEGRLQGDWDLYIKALKQYKDREGDCLVPGNHVEIVDGKGIKLGQWSRNVRNVRKNRGTYLLSCEKIKLLDDIEFIWDENEYMFKDKVRLCLKYYIDNQNLPSKYGRYQDDRLGNFISVCKRNIKYNPNYPEWKINLLKSIPTFFEEKTDYFDKFIEMALLYREEYGHVDIKVNDVINGYKIGQTYNGLRKKYKKGKMESEYIKRLKDIGIDITIKKNIWKFNEKMKLAQQAVDEGITLSFKQQLYKDNNLFSWAYINKTKFSEDELMVINKLIPNREPQKPIKIVDVNTNQVLRICSSISKAGEVLHKEFYSSQSINTARSIIYARLTGRIKDPIYKGRFMFYYATDEEVKKYLEDSKAS